MCPGICHLPSLGFRWPKNRSKNIALGLTYDSLRSQTPTGSKKPNMSVRVEEGPRKDTDGQRECISQAGWAGVPPVGRAVRKRERKRPQVSSPRVPVLSSGVSLAF